jgi:Mor family transcriptional regulator
MEKRITEFLKVIEEIPLNENGCKIWPMGINSCGYGHFSIKNKSYNVSRLLHQTLNPSCHKGKVVRHKCDVRSCCNIDHLEIGTQRQNIMDASNRKRLLFGEKNNKAKFTREIVEEIRTKYPGKSTIELAKEYNTHSQTIRSMIIGKTWNHVPGKKPLINSKRALGEKMGRSKLSEKQVLEIRKYYPEKTGPQLAREYGVGHAMIYAIIKRKNWLHI